MISNVLQCCSVKCKLLKENYFQLLTAGDGAGRGLAGAEPLLGRRGAGGHPGVAAGQQPRPATSGHGGVG